jgi:CRISPR-associated endoribonuclease Cas6
MSAEEVMIRRYHIALAVDGWSGKGAILYGSGHGLLLGLLVAVDPEAASQLHDSTARKAFALSPLTVTPFAGGIGRAELTLATWDRHLGDLITRALAATLERHVTVSGHPACVLDVTQSETTDPAEILRTTAATASAVHARFASPTLFSFGRGAGGHQRYALLPEPKLVIGSWLRTWMSAGGECFGLRPTPEDLEKLVEVRWHANLHTVTVSWGKTALTGFLGDVAFAWSGAEEWGPRLLGALSRFATFCGTGAKTAHGFGWTQNPAARTTQQASLNEEAANVGAL